MAFAYLKPVYIDNYDVTRAISRYERWNPLYLPFVYVSGKVHVPFLCIFPNIVFCIKQNNCTKSESQFVTDGGATEVEKISRSTSRMCVGWIWRS